MVDGVGKTLPQFLVHLTVNVGLDGQKVLGRELIAALQRFVNALNAIGIHPLKRKRVRELLSGDARVGGGQKARGRINGIWHLVKRDVALPLVPGVLNGHTDEACRPLWNSAYRLIGNVALIVGVDRILCGPGPRAQSRRKLRPVGRDVNLVERKRVERWVIERPPESYRPHLPGEEGIQERPVSGGLNV